MKSKMHNKANNDSSIKYKRSDFATYNDSFTVCRESCIFQVQVMMSLSDTQEMEEQILLLLLTPYNNGSVSIATEDIEISRIRESGSVKDCRV